MAERDGKCMVCERNEESELMKRKWREKEEKNFVRWQRNGGAGKLTEKERKKGDKGKGGDSDVGFGTETDGKERKMAWREREGE